MKLRIFLMYFLINCFVSASIFCSEERVAANAMSSAIVRRQLGQQSADVYTLPVNMQVLYEQFSEMIFLDPSFFHESEYQDYSWEALVYADTEIYSWEADIYADIETYLFSSRTDDEYNWESDSQKVGQHLIDFLRNNFKK